MLPAEFLESFWVLILRSDTELELIMFMEILKSPIIMLDSECWDAKKRSSSRNGGIGMDGVL